MDVDVDNLCPTKRTNLMLLLLLPVTVVFSDEASSHHRHRHDPQEEEAAVLLLLPLMRTMHARMNDGCDGCYSNFLRKQRPLLKCYRRRRCLHCHHQDVPSDVVISSTLLILDP
jgi:hypothetical protein